MHQGHEISKRLYHQQKMEAQQAGQSGHGFLPSVESACWGFDSQLSLRHPPSRLERSTICS